MEHIFSGISKAVPEDAEGIFQLNQLFQANIPDFRWGELPWVKEEIDKGHYYVVRDAKGVAGALCMHTDTGKLSRPFPDGETAVIDAIAIRPALQNSGLSRKFREWTEDKCRAEGLTAIVGESFVEYGLERLYTHWGLTRDAEPANFNGHDYYLYSKPVLPVKEVAQVDKKAAAR